MHAGSGGGRRLGDGESERHRVEHVEGQVLVRGLRVDVGPLVVADQLAHVRRHAIARGAIQGAQRSEAARDEVRRLDGRENHLDGRAERTR